MDNHADHYERKLETKAGQVTLRVPKLRRLPFETAIIERYKRREASVEEAQLGRCVLAENLSCGVGRAWHGFQYTVPADRFKSTLS